MGFMVIERSKKLNLSLVSWVEFNVAVDCVHVILYVCEGGKCRGVFRPRQTRQLPRAVDLKGRLLSCQSY